MPSATSPPSQTANTTSPRDILLGFQFRRENRALLDVFEEQRAKAVAEAEAQRLRQEELERTIQLVQQQHKEMEDQMKEKLREMGEHARERDEEIEKSVVERLSARLPSGTFANAIANAQDDDEQQTPKSSPPVLPSVHREEVRRLLQQSHPQSAPAAPSAPSAVVPPHQRYALRRPANPHAAAAGPSSAPNATAKGKENVSTRANLSRKRSIVGAPITPSPATPVTAPATRERSASTSSTLSTAPSSHADEPAAPEPVIPALPFNKRGTPHQANLEVDIYFAAAKKFACERRVHLEGEEEQNKFILQIFKGMKKEERTEVVCALEAVTLAKMNPERTTVQFLGLWREIEAAVDKTVLAEAKAKANLLRAAAMMVER